MWLFQQRLSANKRVKKFIVLNGLFFLLGGQIQIPSLVSIGSAETRTEGKTEAESKTNETSQPPVESESSSTGTSTSEASEAGGLPPSSTSAVGASVTSASTRATKTFPNGDSMTGSLNGLVNFVTHFAGRGIKDYSSGHFEGVFQSVGVSGTAPVNTDISARIRDQLSSKSVKLDYNTIGWKSRHARD